MPGYMSVYSWVSPATAAFRLSRVRPIGRLVAGSPTASRYSRCPCACPVSPSAVERDRKSTRLNSSHSQISYAVFCLKKKKKPPYSHDHYTNMPAHRRAHYSMHLANKVTLKGVYTLLRYTGTHTR